MSVLAASTDVDLAECSLLLHPDDDVAVTTRDLPAGTRVRTTAGEVTLPAAVARGHKRARP